jgi:hypothetical protein
VSAVTAAPTVARTAAQGLRVQQTAALKASQAYETAALTVVPMAELTAARMVEPTAGLRCAMVERGGAEGRGWWSRRRG